VRFFFSVKLSPCVSFRKKRLYPPKQWHSQKRLTDAMAIPVLNRRPKSVSFLNKRLFPTEIKRFSKTSTAIPVKNRPNCERRGEISQLKTVLLTRNRARNKREIFMHHHPRRRQTNRWPDCEITKIPKKKTQKNNKKNACQ
jgi:hypothetical protein